MRWRWRLLLLLLLSWIERRMDFDVVNKIPQPHWRTQKRPNEQWTKMSKLRINVQSDFPMWRVRKRERKKSIYFGRFSVRTMSKLQMYCVTMHARVRVYLCVDECLFVCRFGYLWLCFVALIYLVVSSSNNKLLSRLFSDRNRPARQIPWFNTMFRTSDREKKHPPHDIWFRI